VPTVEPLVLCVAQACAVDKVPAVMAATKSSPSRGADNSTVSSGWLRSLPITETYSDCCAPTVGMIISIHSRPAFSVAKPRRQFQVLESLEAQWREYLT
jgi:hypothetical protein